MGAPHEFPQLPPSLPPSRGGFDPVRLLAGMATALGSTLELREVLHRLARLGLDATGADRSLVMLLEGRDMCPEVVAAGGGDDPVLAEVQAMGREPLDDEQWRRLCSGRALMIEDARHVELIPERWRSRFIPGAVALVPLMAGRLPCGLLAVEWAEPRELDHDEFVLLEALGACAGAAVRNAHAYESAGRRARLQQALTRGAAELVGNLDLPSVADRLAGAYTELIGARLCAIALLGNQRESLEPVATRGAARHFEQHIPLDDLPPHLVERVRKEWERAKLPIELAGEPALDELVGGPDAGVGWYLLVPFVADGRVRGFVLLGFEAQRRLDSDERQAIRSMADLASAAIEQSRLAAAEQRNMQLLHALSEVSTAVADGADAMVIRRVVERALAGESFDVVHVELVANAGGRGNTVDRPRGHVPSAALAVPMDADGRHVGTIWVTPESLGGNERALVESLASGVAEIVERERLRGEVARARLERAVFYERERLACDLHDTAGQVFVAIQLMARDAAERPKPSVEMRRLLHRFAELADGGKWEIDQATRALAFMPSVQRGLECSLRELAAEVTTDSGIDVEVEVAPGAGRLGDDVERALYRVAHEALANAWRHGECGHVGIVLRQHGDTVTLLVEDDGKAASEVVEEGVGIAGMRRAMREVGGTVVVGARPGGGFRVEARVPGGK